MSTIFLNAPAAGQPTFTSALYSLKATTDIDKVAVEIVRDPLGENDLFFSTVLYPHNGIVELSDIGTLIEERFRTTSRSWDTISIRFDDVTVTFTAIYCEYEIYPGFELTECFLSASDKSIVHRNSAVSLTHWPAAADEYIVKFVGLDADGNHSIVQRQLSNTTGTHRLSFTVNEIIKLAITPSGDESDAPLTSVAYFSINHAGIQKIFYIATHPFFLTFGFRNIFNAYEYLDVVCTVKSKTAYNRDITISAGRAVQYDQTVERTYEVQTGPLTCSQVRELEQLIGSRQIQLCASGHDYDILITDHTIEADNDNESLPSIKFTFRFASERPQLSDTDLGSLMPSHNRVFTHEFTAQFA